ncbi:MAG: DHHA1 domain-containing protein [Thermofilum sp.]
MASRVGAKHVAVVCHRDLDGLASAAILLSSRLAEDPSLRYFVRFAQPHELAAALAGLSSLPSLAEVYIIDVAVASDSWSEVKRLLQRLVERGVRVLWVDHHPSTAKRVGELENIGVECRVGGTVSAATLVRDFIPKTSSPEFYEKLAAIAEAYDGGYRAEGPLAEVMETLADALALEPSDEEFLASLLAAWVKKRELIPDEAAERGEKALELFSELLRKAGENIVVDTPKLRVIDLRETRVRGFAGKLLSMQVAETGKIVVLVFRLGSHSAVISARAPQDLHVDLNELFSRVAAEYGGSGGGHARAASLRVPLPYADITLKRLVEALGAS